MKKVLITLPCFNEELVLEKTMIQLVTYARKFLSGYQYRILILDNNSSDSTWSKAQTLQIRHPNLVLIDQVEIPGRGAALRQAWFRHPNYDIYSYMDTDLATDLKDFSTLISKVAEGNDFVTGSRYLPKSDVKRSWRRLFLSRAYNWLLKLVLRVNFLDAQCGFKAFSRRLVVDLIPRTKDDGWFWDTELMILACKQGYKVTEIPVSWREVRDELRRSTVSVWREAIRQLKNIWLMRRRLKANYG